MDDIIEYIVIRKTPYIVIIHIYEYNKCYLYLDHFLLKTEKVLSRHWGWSYLKAFSSTSQGHFQHLQNNRQSCVLYTVAVGIDLERLLQMFPFLSSANISKFFFYMSLDLSQDAWSWTRSEKSRNVAIKSNRNWKAREGGKTVFFIFQDI